MSYALGVDLGTTYTAAAIKRGDRLQIAELGNRSATIPSVVFMREDGTILTADSAVRRGATEPGRLAREFKRRMGDTTPIMLGGSPFSVDALMARLLEDVVASVAEREGGPADQITVAYPANWGQYKKDLLEQAIRRADLDGVTTITEPEAAAAHYASQERLETGATVAVYDLGGGTFDAAVLRKTADGFEFLGEPEGIERLGGIDFDEAVFRHVIDSLRGAMDDLDHDDAVARAAVARLRAECVAAKEALSSDTDVSIPVMLPNVQTEVRLTRAEFEGMIRPALADTIVVIKRALRSAGITADDLHAILLVGGSSRVPLVGQIVAAELGRPIAIDVHPKHSVALGAALTAAGHAPEASSTTAATPVAQQPEAPPESQPDVPVIVPATPDEPMVSADLSEPAPDEGVPTEVVPAAAAGNASSEAPTRAMGSAVPGGPPPGLEPSEASNSTKRNTLIGVGVVAALTIGGGLVFGLGGGDGDAGATATTADVEQTAPPTTDPPEQTAPSTSAAEAPATTAAATSTLAPTTTLPPGPCDGVTGPCAEITSLVRDGGSVTIEWQPFNFTPDMGGIHPHFFWNNATAAQAGTNAPPGEQVPWEITHDLVYTGVDALLLVNQPPDATGICATPGDANLDPAHSVIDPQVVHCVELP